MEIKVNWIRPQEGPLCPPPEFDSLEWEDEQEYEPSTVADSGSLILDTEDLWWELYVQYGYYDASKKVTLYDIVSIVQCFITGETFPIEPGYEMFWPHPSKEAIDSIWAEWKKECERTMGMGD